MFISYFSPLQGKPHISGSLKKADVLFPAHSTFAMMQTNTLLFHSPAAYRTPLITCLLYTSSMCSLFSTSNRRSLWRGLEVPCLPERPLCRVSFKQISSFLRRCSGAGEGAAKPQILRKSASGNTQYKLTQASTGKQTSTLQMKSPFLFRWLHHPPCGLDLLLLRYRFFRLGHGLVAQVIVQVFVSVVVVGDLRYN